MTEKEKAYKAYYDAMNSCDEWRYVNADEARKRIERIKEIESWGGSCDYETWEDMGS